jgi:transcriptional regulator with XRE-family HTH domain
MPKSNGEATPLTSAVITRMRELRHRRGWSAQEMSNRMSTAGAPITRGMIANLENGRRADVTVDELAGAARIFGVHAAWLLFGSGASCSACEDAPPKGFSCNYCGRYHALTHVRPLTEAQS